MVEQIDSDLDLTLKSSLIKKTRQVELSPTNPPATVI